VLLRLDNTSPVSYMNKFGWTVSPRLNAVVKELWLWCMARDITENLPEHCSGQRILRHEGQVGLDAESANICSSLGSTGTGPLRIQADYILSWSGSSAGQRRRPWMPSTRTGQSSRVKGMPTLPRTWWGEYSLELVNKG
jgi:hypothetical protein